MAIQASKDKTQSRVAKVAEDTPEKENRPKSQEFRVRRDCPPSYFHAN